VGQCWLNFVIRKQSPILNVCRSSRLILPMKTYAIKIALRGVSPMIWRRLRIADKTSLASLHYIIQTVQGWTDDHLHCFHIYGKDYGICYDGGLSFPDNVFKVVIDDFKFDAGDRFTYEYNFYEPQLHDIRIESIDEISSRRVGSYLRIGTWDSTSCG
jgi:hypothetical protein